MAMVRACLCYSDSVLLRVRSESREYVRSAPDHQKRPHLIDVKTEKQKLAERYKFVLALLFGGVIYFTLNNLYLLMAKLSHRYHLHL